MFLDDEISDLEDTSDIDVPEFDSDVSLEDYSSGSGKEYVPNFEDLESSEVDISHHTVNNSDSDEDDTPNLNRPIQEFSNPVWLRTYTPEDVNDIESHAGPADPRGKRRRSSARHADPRGVAIVSTIAQCEPSSRPGRFVLVERGVWFRVDLDLYFVSVSRVFSMCK
ncbi:hypothetical protein J6590_001312 [Homalodisca vitripennis]|nr:hypothetical protein J6590_001312 [Homalodisca vitripennis]